MARPHGHDRRRRPSSARAGARPSRSRGGPGGMSGEGPWAALRRFTDARIGLGRAGPAPPIREVLAFAMAHAQARDAVTTPIDWAPIEGALAGIGCTTVRINSAAADRNTYLRRPDLGR